MTTHKPHPSGLWEKVQALYHLWSGRVHRHYGIVYSDRNEFLSAVESYGRATELNPRLGLAYLERGILLWRELGRATHAVRDLTLALDVRPNWPTALFNRGLAHETTGNYRAAMDDLTAYLSLGEKKWRGHATRQLALLRSLFEDSPAEGSQA
jgi:tetratricopeptide (TPR) repeat protein